jgi:hypothetical protein
MSTGHNLRRLIEAVETDDVVAAEAEAKPLALSLLTDPSDARNSFVQNEGFLLTQVHWKLLVDQIENNNNKSNSHKLTSLLASLTPGGLSKILQGNVPQQNQNKQEQQQPQPSESALANMIRDFRQNHLPFLVNNKTPNQLFPSVHQIQDLSAVASKVQRWSADDYSAKYNGSSIGNSTVECCNTMADLFISASFSSSSSSSTAAENNNNNKQYFQIALQFLVFLVAGRAECCSTYVKDIAAPKRRMFQAILQFESCRNLVGAFSPFVRFATSVWFTSLKNGVLVPKETTAKCFEILFSTASSTSVVTSVQNAGSRRQRQENDNDDETNQDQTSSSFDEKIQDRIRNFPSFSESAQENSEAGFSTIAQDIEFSSSSESANDGVSETAREVDRLIPFLRSALFSVPLFDSRSSISTLAAIAFDRERNNNNSVCETRSIIPCASGSVSSLMNNEDSATSGTTGVRRIGLERIAISAVKKLTNEGEN